MSKIILALASVAFFLACSADGLLANNGSVTWGKDVSSSSGGPANTLWCVNHFHEDCTNSPVTLVSDSACKEHWGYGFPEYAELMSFCPSTYYSIDYYD